MRQSVPPFAHGISLTMRYPPPKFREGFMSARSSRRHFIAAGAAAVAAPFLIRGASAQTAWPSRQIRMICSYPAGGQTDLLARAFGEFISRQVGQNVIIENKAGAAGSIGTAEVARAAPDGHTILCSISTTYVMNRVMMKNPGYDMDKDLVLVSVIPGAGLPLVASVKSGVKTLDDFIAFARKSGKVNFGTYSAGSSPHITIHELNKQYGLNIEPIHYRGEAPMWTGIAEGTLDAAMGSYTAAQSVLQSDRGVAFAVHSKKVDAMPNVKTLPEQGATSKFFTVSGFTGWAMPKATPQPIVDRLAALCVAANSDPKVKEVLNTFVLEPALGFKETNALYQRELPVWIESAQSLGMEPV
jgi:tripartite-type tricarboxylate transporter receptor subunit TctC